MPWFERCSSLFWPNILLFDGKPSLFVGFFFFDGQWGKRGSLGPRGHEKTKIFPERGTTNNVSRASETAPFKRYGRFKFCGGLSTYQGVKRLENMLKSNKITLDLKVFFSFLAKYSPFWWKTFTFCGISSLLIDKWGEEGLVGSLRLWNDKNIPEKGDHE